MSNSPTRKPGRQQCSRIICVADMTWNILMVIGDRITDIMLAENLGCRAIYLNEGNHPGAALCTQRWEDIYRFLKQQPRKARISRKTNETAVELTLNLDGSGQSHLDTGIGFWIICWTNWPRHGGLDLSVQVKGGDLHVDEHHTAEDVALTLGAAFRQVLGQKKAHRKIWIPASDG